jgi:hypothetical protein
MRELITSDVACHIRSRVSPYAHLHRQMRELIVYVDEGADADEGAHRADEGAHQLITSDVAWRGPHASHVLRHHVRRRVAGTARVTCTPSSRPTSRGGDRTRHMYSVITSDVACHMGSRVSPRYRCCKPVQPDKKPGIREVVDYTAPYLDILWGRDYRRDHARCESLMRFSSSTRQPAISFVPLVEATNLGGPTTVRSRAYSNTAD